MAARLPRLIAVVGLVIGALAGMAGAFAPSEAARGLLWGIDGTALVVAAALLAFHHVRRGNDIVAAGFLIFVAGETLVVATSAMDLAASRPVFTAGIGLWAASLALVSIPPVMPAWLRLLATIAAALFAATAVMGFSGRPVTALARPLPLFAYPVFAATLLGWAWVHHKERT